MAGRANQKARTRQAIIDACRELTGSGAEVTMPAVARRAMVSEATAYRYFPDLVSVLQEALKGLWPEPAEALAPVADSGDPAERVAFAARHLLAGVHAYQGSVRAMIAHTIAARPPEQSPEQPPGRSAGRSARPGYRFGLIDHALAPFEGALDPGAMTQLKLDLAVAISAEAFFTLTDLCGLPPEEAVASAASTAATLTSAAFARSGRVPPRPEHSGECASHQE